MPINRRRFLLKNALAISTYGFLGSSSAQSIQAKPTAKLTEKQLAAIAAKPILQPDQFDRPIIIESLEHLP